MPKSANQKLKLLCLCKLLWECTDEEHTLTVPEIIARLEAWDIKAERKSIYTDMEALRRAANEATREADKKCRHVLDGMPGKDEGLKHLFDK